ncbi:MAG: DUF3168 domain-containing protein [Comamonas sp.]|nr:DUF3168 domain-containing protein [Comamonas sp.]
MNLETKLVAILNAHCPRNFPVTAEFGTQLPYVIWQRAGGKASRTLDKKPVGNLQNRRIAVTVWDSHPIRAAQLLQQIEAALTTASAIQCTPLEEATDVYDDGGTDAGIFGMQQTFSVWAKR